VSIVRDSLRWAIVIIIVWLCSCGSVPVERRGASQVPVVSRVYTTEIQGVRAAVLRSSFRGMRAVELRPPRYSSDWAQGWVDPGGFLEFYKRIPGDLRVDDLLIEDPVGDTYWSSEYSTAGGPVKFKCGFILHFVTGVPGTTEVQVYEKTPEVWVGEHWDFAHHGIGFGKFHDIRFVEPTVRDRVEVLDFLGGLKPGPRGHPG
jgi:hypothetical protein